VEVGEVVVVVEGAVMDHLQWQQLQLGVMKAAVVIIVVAVAHNHYRSSSSSSSQAVVEAAEAMG
jgi:hypothetical protein